MSGAVFTRVFNAVPIIGAYEFSLDINDVRE